MNLPPWECHTIEDQRAFAAFVMRRLDEMDMAEANASIPEGFSDHMEAVTKKREVAELARQHGLEIAEPPRPRGRPHGDIDALACAIRDVRRMRDIFRRFWGKSNRYTRPTRTAIATEYWELSEEDADALERHFNKGKKSER